MVSGGVAWIREPSRPAGTTRTPRSSASLSVALARAEQPAAVPARRLESLARLVHAVEQLRHLLEHHEARGTRKRVTGMRVGVDVLGPQLPDLLEIVAVEERRRERQTAPERLADADDVRDLLARPHLAHPAEPREDRVDDE